MKIKIKKTVQIESFLVFLLLSDLFIPSIIIADIGLTLSLIMSPVVFVFFLLKNKGIKIIRSWQLSSVLLLGVMVWISSLWSYAVLGVPYSSGDFIESIKYLKFVPYLLFLPLLNLDKFEVALDRTMFVAAFFVLVVGFFQLFFTSSIGLWFAEIYAGRGGHAENLLNSTFRLTLTGSDPNVGGAIAACLAIYFFVKYLDEKKYIRIFLCVVLVLLAILTQSRTVAVGLAFSILFYVSFFYKTSVFRKLFLIPASFLVVCLGYMAILWLELDYIILGFELFFQGDNSSANIRLENFYRAMDWFDNSMIFGYGPAKAIHPTVIDSEYSLILGRYGLLGVLIFGFYFIGAIIKSFKLLRRYGSEKTIAAAALSAYALFGAVIMLTNNLFSGYQLMAPFVVFGMCLELFEVHNNKILKTKLQKNELMVRS